ncbi:MAG: cytochrome c, partial [Vicinamibacterales bacterium]
RPFRHGVLALALLATPLLGACDLGLPAGRTPHREGNRLDMIDQPKLKPQRADVFGGRPTGTLEPPTGAIAADETPYPYTQAQGALAGAELVNPLPNTADVVDHGKFVWENVCITCHGPRGAGDGHLTLLFPKPPSLMTQKVRDWPDGEIFHRPMRGQNSMPSHARQIDARDMWSVVRYIRKMQSEEPVAPPPPAVAPASPVTPSAGAMAGQAPASAPAPATTGAATTVPGGRS